MANPTTNYGFVLPTSSDLVTDLPADFDVALQGVDTRLKALQPGTTLGDLAYSSATANTNTRLPIGTSGQVLAVSGGVPAWTTPTSGMTNPMTTTGDTIYSSSGSTPARLGIGTTGQILTVSGGVPTWSTPAAGGGMTLISSTAMSGSSSITLSSIPQTYKDLIVIIQNTTFNTGGSEIQILFNNGYTAAGTGRWKTSLGDFQGDSLKLTLGNNTSHVDNQNHYCLIKDYASTVSAKPFQFNGSACVDGTGAAGGSFGGGAARTNSAITSLVITTAHSRTFNAGTILLYGAN
jgi:hypothetical protein